MWLFPLNKMFLIFNHVVVYTSPIIPQLFTYCPTDGHWDCFQVLPIVNSNFSSVLIKLLSCLAYLTFIIQPEVFMKCKTFNFKKLGFYETNV